ncbi:MAG: hypothetical protein ACRDTF_12405 [Pseudonocardiaceae bacterium]
MPTVDQIRYGTSSRSTTMTCTVDGRDHLISDQAMAAGLVAGHGAYVATCGHRVVAAPLVTPPGSTCFDCETALHRSRAAATSHRRRGLLARWLRRRVPRTDSSASTGGSHRAVRA